MKTSLGEAGQFSPPKAVASRPRPRPGAASLPAAPRDSGHPVVGSDSSPVPGMAQGGGRVVPASQRTAQSMPGTGTPRLPEIPKHSPHNTIPWVREPRRAQAAPGLREAAEPVGESQHSQTPRTFTETTHSCGSHPSWEASGRHLYSFCTGWGVQALGPRAQSPRLGLPAPTPGPSGSPRTHTPYC